MSAKTGKIEMDSQASLTEIQNFYKNKTIFLTGSTEYVGKLVLEKILRTLHAKHVYVLVSEKDGKSAEARCADIFDSLAFGSLKRQDQEFYKKVSLVEGNCEKMDLGLKDEDKTLIMNEVECIFHCGTTTNVEESLKKATFINVRSTKILLEMAKEMQQLMGFVFFSSAYSNFPRYEIHEQFYEPPVHYNKLIALCEGEEDLIKKSEETWLQDWPNAAMYTLSVAEALLQKEGNGLPISIIRPSHILPSMDDPITGYVEDGTGLISYAVNHAMGVNRVFYYNKGTLDVVPVDYIVNMIIASGWFVGLQKLRLKRGDVTSIDIQIYHCISSQEKPITTEEFFGTIHSVFRDVPTNRMIQIPFAFHTACYYNYKFLILFFHYFMGFLCDTGLKIAGKQPVVVDMYHKIHRHQELLSPYVLKQWYFSNDNAQKLLKRMSFMDRETYPFDILNINWQNYFVTLARGVRVYLLNDPMSTLTESKKRQQRKQIIQLIWGAVFVTILYLIIKVVLSKIIFR